MALLDENRLFPTDPMARDIARALYKNVRDLPIVSPHGHTAPQWFAKNEAFRNPAELFVTPDHYVFCMLHSQVIPLEAMGVPRADGGENEQDPRKIWRMFAEHFYLFRDTPSRIWIEHAFQEVFGVNIRLSGETADAVYDQIAECLAKLAFRPHALFERFSIKALATTESALDDLRWHKMSRDSDWNGAVVTT